MTTPIAYDQPVKNLIDALSATGHVTHKAYKKTSVTLHHNGGRLSHEGVLSVWQKRPASAHFDVDGKGAVCQYVKVNEYAWAVGNTEGNMRTISIEMANSATGGDWPVAEATWRSAARLAGWLFAKVIGERPSRDNFFYHHKWSATACAGPYMDKVYEQVLAAAVSAYEAFVRGMTPSAPNARPTTSRPTQAGPTVPVRPKLVVDGDMGEKTITQWQTVMRTVRDGKISRPSMLIRAVQSACGLRGANVDGLLGPITWRAIQKRLGVKQTGREDRATIIALQKRLNENRF